MILPQSIHRFLVILLATSLLFLAACQESADPKGTQEESSIVETSYRVEEPIGLNVPINDYWRQGKAELNRYELKQNRYREVHPGETVLVFVLEDFLTDYQVKNDNYRNPNSTPVLKTNAIHRFTTGLYDYSIMNSIFTPFDGSVYPHTLKVTNTVQDWCGQVFTQLNHREGEHVLTGFSYFESEGDVKTTIPGVLIEDELFNRIRMNPKAIPQGEVEILPALQLIRLLHLKLAPVAAEIELASYDGKRFEGESLQALTVTMPKLRRTLQIVFEEGGTHEILGWTDKYPSVFDGAERLTVAKRTQKLMTDYWSKNKRADERLREEFGL